MALDLSLKPEQKLRIHQRLARNCEKRVSFHPDVTKKENLGVISPWSLKRKYQDILDSENLPPKCKHVCAHSQGHHGTKGYFTAEMHSKNLDELDRTIHRGDAPTNTHREVVPQNTNVFLTLPSDPRDWAKEDVQNWLQYMKSSHDSLTDVCEDRFKMNGKALCLMSAEMFTYRVPIGGSILYKDFRTRLSRALNSNQAVAVVVAIKA